MIGGGVVCQWTADWEQNSRKRWQSFSAVIRQISFPGLRVVKEFLTFNVRNRFIAIFSRTFHQSLTCRTSIQTKPSKRCSCKIVWNSTLFSSCLAAVSSCFGFLVTHLTRHTASSCPTHSVCHCKCISLPVLVLRSTWSLRL